MTTIMITGASRGLGLEFARQFYSEECRVIATCRNPKKANELNSIGDIDVHSLEIKSHEHQHVQYLSTMNRSSTGMTGDHDERDFSTVRSIINSRHYTTVNTI